MNTFLSKKKKKVINIFNRNNIKLRHSFMTNMKQKIDNH